MSDEDRTDARRLWQDQPWEEVRMSAQEVRALADKFERIVSRRNRREYAASAFVVVWFSVWGWFAERALTALGCWLVVLAAFWIMFHLQRHGSARRPAGEHDLLSGVDFLRSELLRQRDLLRSVWWWYLLPFVPGMLLITVGNWLGQPRDGTYLAAGIFAAMVFVGIGLLNQRVARKLQRRLDDLDTVRHR